MRENMTVRLLLQMISRYLPVATDVCPGDRRLARNTEPNKVSVHFSVTDE